MRSHRNAARTPASLKELRNTIEKRNEMPRSTKTTTKTNAPGKAPGIARRRLGPHRRPTTNRQTTSTPPIVNGCSYEVTRRGKTERLRVKAWDPIARMHVVVSENGRETRLDLAALGSRLRAVRARRHRPRKTDTQHTYLYLCSLGPNTYKVGASSAPQRREREIRTYAPVAKMRTVVRVPSEKGSQWATLEREVLRRFEQHRPRDGGREVLRLSPDQADECAGWMREVCA